MRVLWCVPSLLSAGLLAGACNTEKKNASQSDGATSDAGPQASATTGASGKAEPPAARKDGKRKRPKRGHRGSHDPGTAKVKASDKYVLEAWADNWFAMYIGGKLVVEDSVPITTERSFNAERVSFEIEGPFVAAFVLKDFKETDSGIEYIGKRKQQMGDGGFIAQITRQADGEKVAVTDASWRCLVIHQAPLNKDCEGSADPDKACKFRSVPEPDGWKDAAFDDASWKPATVHSTSAVNPKFGYDAITWDSSAKLIWGADLETDNTVLCRVSVGSG